MTIQNDVENNVHIDKYKLYFPRYNHFPRMVPQTATYVMNISGF